jgi:hypothetical protein
MKNKSLFIVILIAVSLSAAAQKVTVYPNNYLVKTGDMAPDFLIKEAGGKSYKL